MFIVILMTYDNLSEENRKQTQQNATTNKQTNKHGNSTESGCETE